MSGENQQPRIRRAARILLLDPADRVLLFRFTPDDRSPLWATPGGECDHGEDFESAARRELFEETGISADPGPVIAVRTSQFKTFTGEEVIADERYFTVRTEALEISAENHTEVERAVMREYRWFAIAELAEWPETIFPENIAEMLGARVQP